MKLKLDQDLLNEDFFENTHLLGIIAPIKNYFFCWQLNNELGVEFRLNNEVEIHLIKKKRDYFFNIYEWSETETSLTHYLYHNQFDGEYLLPEFRNMDFLWLMKGDLIEKNKLHQINAGIKNIQRVQLVAELTSEKIKNKGNMIF